MRIILQTKFFSLMLTRFMDGSPKLLKKRLLVAAFAGMFILASCTKASIFFGQNDIAQNYSNIVQTDTMTTWMSTLFVDSIPTSASGNIYVGNYNDDYYGNVNVRSYFEITPPGYTSVDPLARFDSMVLYLVPVKQNYYGDTSVPIDIYVNELASPMNFSYTHLGVINSNFFNTDSFPVLPTPLGHVQQLMSPTRGDTVYIKLDSTLGAQFFVDYRDQLLNFQDAANFLNYFPGIRLDPGPNSGNIFGFKDSVVVKLWYHNPTVLQNSETFLFKYSNKAYQFNEIHNTPVAPLTKFQHVYQPIVQQVYSDSSNFQHLTYVNGMLGYNTKIEFPYLRGLYNDSNFVKIQRALLVLRPIYNTFDQYKFPLPTSLQLYTTNFYNLPITAVASGALTLDYFTGNTTYTFDITNYLTEELTNLVATQNRDGLIVVPTGTSATRFNRAIFGDPQYKSIFSSSSGYVQAQVILYYLGVKPSIL